MDGLVGGRIDVEHVASPIVAACGYVLAIRGALDEELVIELVVFIQQGQVGLDVVSHWSRVEWVGVFARNPQVPELNGREVPRDYIARERHELGIRNGIGPFAVNIVSQPVIFRVVEESRRTAVEVRPLPKIADFYFTSGRCIQENGA